MNRFVGMGKTRFCRAGDICGVGRKGTAVVIVQRGMRPTVTLEMDTVVRAGLMAEEVVRQMRIIRSGGDPSKGRLLLDGAFDRVF